jgi:uncharacterized membrane protein YhaH (DUF805 family)
MNPLTILIYPFDWRGVLNRAAYRRNLSILVLVDLIIGRLDLLSESASYGWTALITIIGLSFNARRYHDMGRSAAWIVWANLVFAAVAVAIFQFIPNILDSIPLPEGWRVDAAGEAVFWRFVLPAVVGAICGNIVQSLWLMVAPSAEAPNPYATATLDRRAGQDGGNGLDEAALQGLIDRHLAMSQGGQGARAASDAGPQVRPAASVNERPRQFGRRGH